MLYSSNHTLPPSKLTPEGWGKVVNLWTLRTQELALNEDVSTVAVFENSGEAIGVIPRDLVEKEIAQTRLRDLRVTSSMHERKAMMAELSDGFIALPGGIGTFEEMFEIWTWAQLGYHAKPCGMLNTAGFYNGLSTFLDRVVNEGFLKPKQRDMMLCENEPEKLLRAMRAYVPSSEEKWIRSERAT